MVHWKKNSIAWRLTVQVIFFSTMVAFLLTALQLYLDYRQDVLDIYSFFASVEESSVRPLEESVWILDDLQINLQLEGLIRRQDVVYAAVAMNGQIAWAKGTRALKNSLPHFAPLFHQVRGSSEQIGTLQVVASLDGIYQRLLRRIFFLLGGTL